VVAAPILTVLQHGTLGSWDEVAMLALSALIGVALAMMLGSKGKKKS
jgi:hypothetical protein